MGNKKKYKFSPVTKGKIYIVEVSKNRSQKIFKGNELAKAKKYALEKKKEVGGFVNIQVKRPVGIIKEE